MNHRKSDIPDKWLFLFVYPVIAVAAVHIGNDNTFGKLVKIPSYYSDLLLAFICSYGLGFYLKSLLSRIDRNYDWDYQFKNRLIHQVIWGVIIPVVIIMSIELVYLYFIDISLKESSILYLELPIVALFCLLINLVYFILYLRKNNQNLKRVPEKEERMKENFVAKSGNQFVNVRHEELACFYVQNKVTFLMTFDGKKYIYDLALKDLKESLSPKEFFQLNRQLIASRSSIVKYNQTNTRRLKVSLEVPLPVDAFVAKNKATEFIKWLDQK